jgi:hypothetical protein
MRFIEAGTLSGNVTNTLAQITGAMATRWICEVGRNFELFVLGHHLGDLYDICLTLPPGFEDPYIEHLDVVQNPDLGNETEEEIEVEAMESEEEQVEEQEEEEEEEEALVLSYRKYSPLSTRSGKVRK